MKYMWSVLFVVLTGLLTGQAFGKEISLEELRAIQAKMKAPKNLSVDFTQTKFSSMRGRKTTRVGRALFNANPSKFKWMLETPTQEYKIFDGKDFYDYSPTEKTAKRFSPTGPQTYELRQIVDLVLNFDTLLKRYDLTTADQDGDLIKVELKPKTQGEIQSVELHMSKAQGFIQFLKLNLNGGDSLSHDFKNASTQPVPADAFTLPKGVKFSEGA